jgi:peroxiredoxin
MISANFDEPAAPMPEALKHASLAEQAKWWEAFSQTDAGKNFAAEKQKNTQRVWTSTHGFEIQPDGTFRIEDVAAGKYSMHFDVVEKHDSNQPQRRLGYAASSFTLPPMSGERSDEPLVIPPVAVRTLDEIKVGDVVPDFMVKTLDDQPLRLTDFRGKVVLLEFWATWCGPCVNETEHLKDVYGNFAGDARFAMISLSLDPRPDDPIKFVAKNGLAWHEGFLGDWDNSKVANDYHVEEIPTFFLIGADGKVLARPDWSGASLKGDISKALEK